MVVVMEVMPWSTWYDIYLGSVWDQIQVGVGPGAKQEHRKLGKLTSFLQSVDCKVASRAPSGRLQAVDYK